MTCDSQVYLGHLQYFLNIKILRSKEGMVFLQRKYVLDLLQEIGMFGSKSVAILMNPRTYMYEKESNKVDSSSYIY